MIKVIWQGPGLYVGPVRVGRGKWEWRLWIDTQPPSIGTYLESEKAACDFEKQKSNRFARIRHARGATQ